MKRYFYLVQLNNNTDYNDSIDFKDQFDEQPYKDEILNEPIGISNDWNDESYSRW